MTETNHQDSFPGLGVGGRIIRCGAWLIRAKYTHGALIIVQDDRDRLLLVQERLRERSGWGLPGGFSRNRETPDVTASRELREETGVAVPTDRLALVTAYRQPWARHFEHVFHLRIASDTRLHRGIGEVRAVKWYRSRELPVLTRSAYHALTAWGWTG